jgi:hypothetical protein
MPRRTSGKDLYAEDTDKTLECYGFDYRTDQGRPGATAGFEGRPDVLAVRRRKATYIEIKSAAERFVFASWRDEQRIYADRLEKNGESVYIWLNMGRGRPDLKHMRDEKMARRAFLIPLDAFRQSVRRAEEIKSASIPYRIKEKGSRQRRVFDESGFSAETMFGQYELQYHRAGAWIIPVSHPFAIEHSLKEPSCPKPPTSKK